MSAPVSPTVQAALVLHDRALFAHSRARSWGRSGARWVDGRLEAFGFVVAGLSDEEVAALWALLRGGPR